MEQSLAATLSDLSGSDPDANVASIKNAVTNYLHEADPGSIIRQTDYFNHTFTPDLVLTWEDESKGSRSIYIRTDSREASLREDLEWAPASEPLFLPLAEVVHASSPADRTDARTDLDTASAQSGAMIASPRSLEALRSADPSSRVARLFSRAVVRGGRGLLDVSRAEVASSTVLRGYQGAQVADSSPTEAAIEGVETLVRLNEATAVTRFLQAVWIGGGGAESAFPGATGVSGGVTTDSLQLLLDMGDVGDDEFWTRVSRSVDLDRLTRLTVAPDSSRFQELVRQAMKRLRGKGFAVLRDRNELLTDGELRWYARDGVLGLQSRHFRAAFSPSVSSSLDDAGQPLDGDGLSIRTLLDRLEDQRLEITRLSFDTGTGTALTITLAEPGTLADDELLSSLTEPLESNATAVSVDISLSGGRSVHCNLKNGRARGNTGAKYFLPEMLESVLPVLQHLTSAEKRSLSQVLESTAPAGKESGSTSP